MSIIHLVIPVFFIALILYVSWPLLAEPPRPESRDREKKQ